MRLSSGRFLLLLFVFVWLLSRMSLQLLEHVEPFSSSFLWVPSHSCHYNWLSNLIALCLFVCLFVWVPSHSYNYLSSLIALCLFVCLFVWVPSHSCRYNCSSSLIALFVIPLFFEKIPSGRLVYRLPALLSKFAIYQVSFSSHSSHFYHFRSPSPQAFVPQGFSFEKKHSPFSLIIF